MSLVSAGLAVPGVRPLGNTGTLGGITLPGVTPMPCALFMNPLAAGCINVPQVIQAPLTQQHAAAAFPKLNQVRYSIYLKLTILSSYFCFLFALLICLTFILWFVK